MLAALTSWMQRCRRWLSPVEWAIRLMRLPVSPDPPTTPGLLLIQLDGLGHDALTRALADGRLPFLRRLREAEQYRLRTLYSGVPASTPAVQAELFYGVRHAVPAFNFRDHDTGRVFRMYDPPAAAAVEAKLAAAGPGLLAGGSAWGDIFTGGAREPHFCCASLERTPWLPRLLTNPPALALFAATQILLIARVIGLILLETALALAGFVRGAAQGRGILEELQFILTRVGICVLLREVAVLGASADAARGLPIIHINLVGYDEQAHRRGPSSAFARWTLRGVDAAVRRLWEAAHRSSRRHYDVWIYADHGQEDSEPYPLREGRTVQQAIEAILRQPVASGHASGGARHGIQTRRINLVGGRLGRRFASRDHVEPAGGVIVTAMGALGHLYLPTALPEPGRAALARRLVAEAHIPLVLSATSRGHATAWTAEGEFLLPQDASRLVGGAHPYAPLVANDLVRLCHHPDAGVLVISGWRREGRIVSFPVEFGSHAGPGARETSAFTLLPEDAPLPSTTHGPLRPLDLRHAALWHLEGARTAAEAPQARPTRTLRVMTYNVHGCVGMDGRLHLDRIARVIARQAPDIVALQELDVGRPRSGRVDQARALAERLAMTAQFYAPLHLEEGVYGNALLTRLPIVRHRSGQLYQARQPSAREPRGALLIAVDVHGRPVHVITAHLSLWPDERRRQAEELLGPAWAGSPECRGPLIVCGDFNAPPGSATYRLLTRSLHDAQRLLSPHRPAGTWGGRSPLGRIDHVFLRGLRDVRRITVPSTALERTASDHLPLVIELVLPADDHNDKTPESASYPSRQ